MVKVFRLLNNDITSEEYTSNTNIGGSLGILYSIPGDDKLIVYADEEGMNKDLDQNESAAYLLVGINPRFSGLIYGPIVVVTKYPKATRRMEVWMDRLKKGYLNSALDDEDLTDNRFKELWELPEGEYERKYPLI